MEACHVHLPLPFAPILSLHVHCSPSKPSTLNRSINFAYILTHSIMAVHDMVIIRVVRKCLRESSQQLCKQDYVTEIDHAGTAKVVPP